MKQRVHRVMVSSCCLALAATVSAQPPRTPPIDSPVVHPDRTVTFAIKAPDARAWEGQPWLGGLRALTTNEVALPDFNAFKLFSRLEPHRVAVDAPGMIPIDTIIADSVRAEPDLGTLASVDGDGARLTVTRPAPPA